MSLLQSAQWVSCFLCFVNIFITDQFTINVFILQFCCIITVIYVCSFNVIFSHSLLNFFFILMKYLIVIISSLIIYLFHKVCTLWMSSQTLFWIWSFDFVRSFIIFFKFFINLHSSVSEFFFWVCCVSLHLFDVSTLL